MDSNYGKREMSQRLLWNDLMVITLNIGMSEAITMLKESVHKVFEEMSEREQKLSISTAKYFFILYVFT